MAILHSQFIGGDMKRLGNWMYCEGHLFNLATKQLVGVRHLPEREVTTQFVNSGEFQVVAEKSIVPPPPSAVVNQIVALEITDKCNYACRYCFEGKSSENSGFMSFENACHIIDPMPSGSELRFFGGEPLLNFGLIERLVDRYPQHQYSLVTNGSLVTKEVAEYLVHHKFNVGMSYDGRCSQRENRLALLGDSMTDFQRAMRLLSAAGLAVGVSTVITKEHIEHLYDIHLEVFGEWGAGGWAYLLAYRPDMILKDLDAFKEQIFAIIQDFPSDHLVRINDLRKWCMKASGEWPLKAYCGSGICYRAVAVDGTERLCPFFLRESTCYSSAMRAVEVNCAKCSIWNYCHGGCLALNRFGSGNTHHSHPFACKKNMIYFEAGLRTRIKIFLETNNKEA